MEGSSRRIPRALVRGDVNADRQCSYGGNADDAVATGVEDGAGILRDDMRDWDLSDREHPSPEYRGRSRSLLGCGRLDRPGELDA